jgi:hypothetical protein
VHLLKKLKSTHVKLKLSITHGWHKKICIDVALDATAKIIKRQMNLRLLDMSCK